MNAHANEAPGAGVAQGDDRQDPRQAHVAIVGAGHAGGRVAQHLRALGHAGRISLIGDEAHAPYERPALSKAWLTDVIAPWTPPQEGDALAAPLPIALAPETFWRADALHDASIERHVARAVGLDAPSRTLQLSGGTELAFDRLVVATGGSPRDGGIAGADLPGVHVLRTVEDSLALRDDLARCKGLVIVGAGVIGMEVASSAVSLGVPVTVIEAGDRILSRCLPPQASDWLLQAHRAQGVEVHFGVGVAGIVPQPAATSDTVSTRLSVQCRRLATVPADGKDGATFTISADTVLIAIGVDCRPEFLLQSGLADARGVVVDACCRSPDAPWLYAAGDVACVMPGGRQETWRNAENQARLVAENLLGANRTYVETQWMWSDQHGFNIQVVGQPDPTDAVIVRGALGAGPAVMLSFRDGVVTAGVLVNAGRERRFVEKLVASGMRIDVARLADPAVPLREFAA